MKKRLLNRLLALSLAFAFLFVGCAKAPVDKKSTANGEETTTQSVDEDVTIRFMSWHGEQSESFFYDGYKAIADDYTELHPNVTIEFIYQPQEGYEQLLDTQFIANSAPEIIHMQRGMNMNYSNKGVLYNLSNDLSAKSAYSDKNAWFDTFVGGTSSFSLARSSNQFGGIFFVPNDENPTLNVGQPYAYNKEIFREAGLDPESPPEIWSEFIAVCETIKASGKIPIAADNARWIGWSLGDIGAQFGEKAANQFYDAKYNNDEKGVFFMDKVQIGLANGQLRNLDYYDDVLKIWTDFSQYWQEGWTGTAYEEASNLFFMQEAAMQKIGSWDHTTYKNTIDDTFEWGIFPIPYIDKATSEYSISSYKAPSGQQNYGFAINGNIEENTAMQKVVIDFMQYLTSVDAQTKYVEIAKSYSPVEGVLIPDELKGYVNPVEKSTATQVLGVSWIERGDGSVWNGYAQDLLTGRITADEFKEKAADLSQRAGKDYCESLLQPDGYTQQLADAQKQLAAMEESKANPIAIESQKEAVDSVETRQEMMIAYYEK